MHIANNRKTSQISNNYLHIDAEMQALQIVVLFLRDCQDTVALIRMNYIGSSR